MPDEMIHVMAGDLHRVDLIQFGIMPDLSSEVLAGLPEMRPLTVLKVEYNSPLSPDPTMQLEEILLLPLPVLAQLWAQIQWFVDHDLMGTEAYYRFKQVADETYHATGH